MRQVVLGLVVLILAAALVAPAPATAAANAGAIGFETNFVQIVNFAFMPPTTSILAGDHITWKNITTDTQHTSTSDNGVWDSGVLNPGQSFTFTFTKPGTYPFHCNIHPFMKGTILVR